MPLWFVRTAVRAHAAAFPVPTLGLSVPPPTAVALGVWCPQSFNDGDYGYVQMCIDAMSLDEML